MEIVGDANNMESSNRPLDMTTASMDLVALNNLVVSLRSVVKRCRVQVVHKLTHNIKCYKKRRGPDDQVKAFLRKADRVAAEITALKTLENDRISKFALANTRPLESITDKDTPQERVLVRLATHKVLKERVDKWRREHDDWKSLAAFLLYKNTGRRIKKKKSKNAKSLTSGRPENAKGKLEVKSGGGDSGGDAVESRGSDNEVEIEEGRSGDVTLSQRENGSGGGSSGSNSGYDSDSEGGELDSEVSSDLPSVTFSGKVAVASTTQSRSAPSKAGVTSKVQPDIRTSKARVTSKVQPDIRTSKVAVLSKVKSKVTKGEGAVIAKVQPKMAPTETQFAFEMHSKKTPSDASPKETPAKATTEPPSSVQPPSIKAAPVNPEMVVKKFSLDDLGEEDEVTFLFTTNATEQEIGGKAPDAAGADVAVSSAARKKRRDAFFMGGEDGSSSDASAAADDGLAEDQEVDATMSRGRDLMQSAFVGSLADSKQASGEKRFKNPLSTSGPMAKKPKPSSSDPKSTGADKTTPASSKELHPSWEASRLRKLQQSSIRVFEGKKKTFDDD